MIEFSLSRSHNRLDRINQHPAFLKRLAVLLKEGYTFHDGLILLLPHHSKNYEEILSRIESDIKGGLGVSNILMSLGFSSSSLLPVIISEVDGRLAEALEGIADRLIKVDERRRS